jgi:hypothetical protein
MKTVMFLRTQRVGPRTYPMGAVAELSDADADDRIAHGLAELARPAPAPGRYGEPAAEGPGAGDPAPGGVREAVDPAAGSARRAAGRGKGSKGADS